MNSSRVFLVIDGGELAFALAVGRRHNGFRVSGHARRVTRASQVLHARRRYRCRVTYRSRALPPRGLRRARSSSPPPSPAGSTGVWPATPLTLSIAALVVCGGPILGDLPRRHRRRERRAESRSSSRTVVAGPPRLRSPTPGPRPLTPKAAAARALMERRDSASAPANLNAVRKRDRPPLACGGVLLAAACVSVAPGRCCRPRPGSGSRWSPRRCVFAALERRARGRCCCCPRARGQPAHAADRAPAAAAAAALDGDDAAVRGARARSPASSCCARCPRWRCRSR